MMMKPAKVKMFIPKRMSLVSIGPCHSYSGPPSRAGGTTPGAQEST